MARVTARWSHQPQHTSALSKATIDASIKRREQFIEPKELLCPVSEWARWCWQRSGSVLTLSGKVCTCCSAVVQVSPLHAYKIKCDA